jgi:hypothetical protein
MIPPPGIFLFDLLESIGFGSTKSDYLFAFLLRKPRTFACILTIFPSFFFASDISSSNYSFFTSGLSDFASGFECILDF